MMALQRRAPARAALQPLSREEHERLDELFERLAAAVRRGSREEARRTWPPFEQELRAHFELEERTLLPEFTRFDPNEVAELRREHDRIRGVLDAISVELERGTCGSSRLAEFLELLKAHARREDALLYRWAE